MPSDSPHCPYTLYGNFAAVPDRLRQEAIVRSIQNPPRFVVLWPSLVIPAVRSFLKVPQEKRHPAILVRQRQLWQTELDALIGMDTAHMDHDALGKHRKRIVGLQHAMPLLDDFRVTYLREDMPCRLTMSDFVNWGTRAEFREGGVLLPAPLLRIRSPVDGEPAVGAVTCRFTTDLDLEGGLRPVANQYAANLLRVVMDKRLRRRRQMPLRDDVSSQLCVVVDAPGLRSYVADKDLSKCKAEVARIVAEFETIWNEVATKAA